MSSLETREERPRVRRTRWSKDERTEEERSAAMKSVELPELNEEEYDEQWEHEWEDIDDLENRHARLNQKPFYNLGRGGRGRGQARGRRGQGTYIKYNPRSWSDHDHSASNLPRSRNDAVYEPEEDENLNLQGVEMTNLKVKIQDGKRFAEPEDCPEIGFNDQNSSQTSYRGRYARGRVNRGYQHSSSYGSSRGGWNARGSKLHYSTTEDVLDCREVLNRRKRLHSDPAECDLREKLQRRDTDSGDLRDILDSKDSPSADLRGIIVPPPDLTLIDEYQAGDSPNYAEQVALDNRSRSGSPGHESFDQDGRRYGGRHIDNAVRDAHFKMERTDPDQRSDRSWRERFSEERDPRREEMFQHGGQMDDRNRQLYDHNNSGLQGGSEEELRRSSGRLGNVSWGPQSLGQWGERSEGNRWSPGNNWTALKSQGLDGERKRSFEDNGERGPARENIRSRNHIQQWDVKRSREDGSDQEREDERMRARAAKFGRETFGELRGARGREVSGDNYGNIERGRVLNMDMEREWSRPRSQSGRQWSRERSQSIDSKHSRNFRGREQLLSPVDGMTPWNEERDFVLERTRSLSRERMRSLSRDLVLSPPREIRSPPRDRVRSPPRDHIRALGRDRGRSPPRGLLRSPSRSPSRERMRSLSRERLRSPVAERARSPPRQRLRSPLRERVRSPLVDRDRSPVGDRVQGSRERVRSPLLDRVRARSPLRERIRSPSRERVRSSPRERARSPIKERARSPPREVARSPLRVKVRSPPRERGRSPLRDRGRSPARERVRSPARERVRSPPRERGRSPPRERAKSPPRDRARSPREHARSPLRVLRSPLRERPRSPQRERERSPLRGRIRSPLRDRLRSPLRDQHRNSPRDQTVSSLDRDRVGGQERRSREQDKGRALEQSRNASREGNKNKGREKSPDRNRRRSLDRSHETVQQIPRVFGREAQNSERDKIRKRNVEDNTGKDRSRERVRSPNPPNVRDKFVGQPHPNSLYFKKEDPNQRFRGNQKDKFNKKDDLKTGPRLASDDKNVAQEWEKIRDYQERRNCQPVGLPFLEDSRKKFDSSRDDRSKDHGTREPKLPFLDDKNSPPSALDAGRSWLSQSSRHLDHSHTPWSSPPKKDRDRRPQGGTRNENNAHKPGTNPLPHSISNSQAASNGNEGECWQRRSYTPGADTHWDKPRSDFDNGRPLHSKGLQSPNEVVFVRGLARDITDMDIRKDISDCKLWAKEVRLVIDNDSGLSRGFAFITFNSVDEATRWMEIRKGVLNLRHNNHAPMDYSHPTSRDWECVRCHTMNFRHRTACHLCGRIKEDCLDGWEEASPYPTNALLLRGLNSSTNNAEVVKSLKGRLEGSTRLDAIQMGKDANGRGRPFCFVQLTSVVDSIALYKSLTTEPFFVDGQHVIVSYCQLDKLPPIMEQCGPQSNQSSHPRLPAGLPPNLTTGLLNLPPSSPSSNIPVVTRTPVPSALKGLGVSAQAIRSMLEGNYTEKDIPVLAQYCASSYAKTPQEKVAYINYYTKHYKDRLLKSVASKMMKLT